MKTAKFWALQIVMVAMISLAFGPSVFAAPPDNAKADKTVALTSDEDTATHGEMNRMDNANLESGKATWKASDPAPACTSETLNLCTNADECMAAGGQWFDPVCF